MESVYLSSHLPRLQLASEADVHNAVASELLEESHFLDLKREVKAGRAANKETARDLAQFAIDGGTVIIGLAESDGAVELSPERLEGLAERIELIARTNCDPPLAVISRSIPTAADPHVGYVIVHVPASPSAPHMVEGRYLGRGDKTKRYLSDAEVLRLHALRARREVDAETLLVAEFDRDPFNILRKRHQGHGFFVAEPAMPRRGMLLGLTDPPVDWNKVMTFVNQSHSPHNPAQQAIARVTTSGFRPDIGDLRTLDRRAAGVALSTYDIQQGRLISDQARIDGSAAELEIRDDGGLRIYLSSLTRASSDDGPQLFYETRAVGLAHRLLALAAAAAEEAGYFGNWTLAFGATGMRGSESSLRSGDLDINTHPYPESQYTESTAASYADLTQQPCALVDQLVGRLLRGFGTRHAFLPALVDLASSPAAK